MMQTVPELPSSKLARQLIATPELVDTAIDLGIGLAAFDDISACIVCRGPYRREMEATAPRIRSDIHYTERFYYHEAIDYLLDVIRFSRELFLRDLDAGHPTQWSRGAKPLPPPKEFQRDYPAELRKIKAAVAQHFAERFPDRV